MEGENWTVVVRRRASKLRPSVSETTPSDSSNHAGKSPKRHPSQARCEDQECDEAHLLLKLKRSMERVQESAFFRMLLDQVQSPPVLNHLRRAASASVFDVIDGAHGCVSDEGKILDVFTDASTHKKHDTSLQFRSSNEDSILECVCALVQIPCQNTDNEINCNALKAISKVCRAKDCSNVECESLLSKMPCESAQKNSEGNAAHSFAETSYCIYKESESSPGVSNGRDDEETKWHYRRVEAACCATHVESSKGLTRINSVENCKHSTMKQTPCHQISEKPWCLQVVLYGLGSIANSEISRCQLALILLLKQKFSWVGDVEIYDPVLSQSECKVISDMGCLPIAVNEEGRRSISRPTLFYMPHCEEWLYDNVLQANWVPHTLGQLVILGNSFQDYQERWSAPIRRKLEPPFYVKQYQQVAQEMPLKATSSPDLPGFNNMSWHFYSPPDKCNCFASVCTESADGKVGVAFVSSTLVVN